MTPTTGKITNNTIEGPSGTVVIATPGLLSNDLFFAPVQREVLRHGSLIEVAFADEEGFDGWATAQSIAELIEATADTEENDKVVILGVSLGGLLFVEACRHLSKKVREKIRLIAIDAPTGVHDIYGGVNRALARAMRFMPRGAWVEPYGKRVMEQILIPPKPENIEAWNPATDYDYLGGWPPNAELRDQMIIDSAMSNMMSNSFRRYVQQIAWIVEAGKTLNWSVVSGIPGIYLACVGEANETVVQPQASELWTMLTGMRVVEVSEGAHAALAEQPTLYRGMLSETIAQL